MENEILKICGVALLTAVAVAVLGAVSPSSGGILLALKAAGTVIALGGVVMLIFSVLESLNGVAMGDESEYISVMVRALALCIVCRIASDICRDCGQATLAAAVESAGKVGMLLLAMPTVIELLGVL